MPLTAALSEEEETLKIVKNDDDENDGEHDGVRLVLLLETAVRVHGERQVQAEGAEELHQEHVRAVMRTRGSGRWL